MKIVDAGHTYELDNIDGGTQTLQFIHKEPNTDDGALPGALKTMNNGTTNEEVLAVLVDRLTFLNEKLSDPHTVTAIELCQSALKELEARTAERKAAMVEGTNNALPPTAPKEATDNQG